MIFDNIERANNDSAKPGETQFGYLNRSGRVEAERVRNLVEDWLNHYPAIDRATLIGRLRSPIDSAHISAFFELALHELLIRSGHTVMEIEPEVPNSSKQPDFLVESPSNHRFYVEAVTSMGATVTEAAARTRLDDAIRIIDEADAASHFLNLRTAGKPTKPVTLRRLRRDLNEWIAGLTPYEASLSSHPFVYEEHGMRLTIDASPRFQPQKQWSGALGVQSSRPFVATPGDGIREAVDKKASRYGALSEPYVVAINAIGNNQSARDAIDAMFGSPCAVLQLDGQDVVGAQMSRNPDGVWQNEKGPRKQGLSAIISTERLTPWDVGQRRARLIRNPWATKPLADISLGNDEINVDDGRPVESRGQPLNVLFDLPIRWPED